MPDPLSLATGVVSLVANSYKFSKEVYELIDGIKSAPKHIRNISDDLKALSIPPLVHLTLSCATNMCLKMRS